MPTYKILVTRDCTESALIMIVASDQATAERAALKDSKHALFVVDDGSDHWEDSYITSVEEFIGGNLKELDPCTA